MSADEICSVCGGTRTQPREIAPHILDDQPCYNTYFHKESRPTEEPKIHDHALPRGKPCPICDASRPDPKVLVEALKKAKRLLAENMFLTEFIDEALTMAGFNETHPNPAVQSEREKVLVEALERIANPLKAIHADVKREGTIVNGPMAVQLATDSAYLKQLAREALATYHQQSKEEK